MIGLFTELKSLLKIKRVRIDNWIMRLNYSFTVIILFVFCIIISTREYSGEPIDCLVNDLVRVPQTVINTYCWTLVTFNFPESYNKKVGLDIPYPGIDNSLNTNKYKFYSYYQYVSFILFVQAIFFYAPRWLWKNWEGGLMEYLTLNLNEKIDPLKIETDYIVNYLTNSKGRHNYYAYRFLFCELLTLLNIVLQFVALDWIFDGHFLTYGYDVFTFYKFGYTSNDSLINPMTVLFPKMTMCSLFSYGPSANIETRDALCLLPLNVINDKIYLFFWVWCIFLAFFTLFTFIFHLFLLLTPALRFSVFRHKLMDADLKEEGICPDYITRNFPSFGDWFILHMLSENTDQIIYNSILKNLQSSKLNAKKC